MKKEEKQITQYPESEVYEEVGFGDSTISIKRGHIWFNEYHYGISGRKLKEVYDLYCKVNNNPF